MLNVGLSRQSVDLGPFGATGCRLWTPPLVSATLSTSPSGRASLALAVPNSTSLFGVTLYAQWFVYDTVNTLGVVTTDGAMFRIGRR